jgi:peptidoglycan-associated lipoprotein
VVATLLILASCGSKEEVAPPIEEPVTEEPTDYQIEALKGEDIPLFERPSEATFEEPTDTATFRDINFEFDKYRITEEARPVLDGIARWMNDRADAELLVEGHCDERGTEEYNLALGEQRALSARRYLVSLGVAPERVHTVSYGESRPVDPRHNEAAWARNRRAHFLVKTSIER